MPYHFLKQGPYFWAMKTKTIFVNLSGPAIFVNLSGPARKKNYFCKMEVFINSRQANPEIIHKDNDHDFVAEGNF